jgi:4-amino-4-deoxychorismate lyase
MLKTLINGSPQDTISALDRGLHYGDGVFETIKVQRGCMVLLQEHLKRLYEGCDRLRLMPPSRDVITEEASTLINNENKAVLKIIITRGPGGRGYRIPSQASATRIMLCYPYPDYPEERVMTGVTVSICSARLSTNPLLAGIKHLNRLEQVLAANEWHDHSIVEGLMKDQMGHIIEGTMSNVFLVSNNHLITPDLTKCGVAGIMRQQVLDIAQDLGISHDIREVTEEDLFAAEEVFLTNSLIGIWPVKTIQNRNFDRGLTTQRLMRELDRREV